MKKIFLTLIILLISAICYSQIGFTTYVTEQPVKPTIEEYLDQMPNNEKVFVINGFGDKIKPKQVDKSQVKVPVAALNVLYREMKNIRDYAALLMRGKVSSGQVMITPPKNKAALITALVKKFNKYFNEGQITAFTNKMLLHSKKNVQGQYIGIWKDYKDGVTQ